jgi:hypothetical protein
VTTRNFVGPDGKTYSASEPDEGGFFIYYDRRSWVITFPFLKEPAKHFYYCGDELPSSSMHWRTRELGTRNPFPDFVRNAFASKPNTAIEANSPFRAHL